MTDTSNGSSWMDKLGKLFSDELKNRQDILTLLAEAQEQQLIDADALNMIEGVMQVSEARVREIMVPRLQMDFISESDSLEEVLEKMLDAAHSRYPVLSEDNQVIGVLLAKDVLRAVLNSELNDRSQLVDIYREPFIIPESKRLNVLLREFRSSRNHMALVVDEYGETAGLVTIEDVLEQIVGEIEDEHDTDEDNIQKHISGGYSVAAITPLEDFNRFFNTHLKDSQIETIGGFITRLFTHIPEEGESIQYAGLSFKVFKANGRRVECFIVHPIEVPEVAVPSGSVLTEAQA